MSSREEELLSRVEAIMAATERDASRVAREHAALDEQRASAARRGELGRDWQEVQARIDQGRTSVRAVFAGDDESPAAVRLRARADTAFDALLLPDHLAEQVETLQPDLP